MKEKGGSMKTSEDYQNAWSRINNKVGQHSWNTDDYDNFKSDMNVLKDLIDKATPNKSQIEAKMKIEELKEIIGDFNELIASKYNGYNCDEIAKLDNKSEQLLEAIGKLEQHQRYIDNEPYTWEEITNMKRKYVYCKSEKINFFILEYLVDSDGEKELFVVDSNSMKWLIDYKDNEFYPREVTNEKIN